MSNQYRRTNVLELTLAGWAQELIRELTYRKKYASQISPQDQLLWVDARLWEHNLFCDHLRVNPVRSNKIAEHQNKVLKATSTSLKSFSESFRNPSKPAPVQKIDSLSRSMSNMQVKEGPRVGGAHRRAYNVYRQREQDTQRLENAIKQAAGYLSSTLSVKLNEIKSKRVQPRANTRAVKQAELASTKAKADALIQFVNTYDPNADIKDEGRTLTRVFAQTSDVLSMFTTLAMQTILTEEQITMVAINATHAVNAFLQAKMAYATQLRKFIHAHAQKMKDEPVLTSDTPVASTNEHLAAAYAKHANQKLARHQAIGTVDGKKTKARPAPQQIQPLLERLHHVVNQLTLRRRQRASSSVPASTLAEIRRMENKISDTIAALIGQRQDNAHPSLHNPAVLIDEAVVFVGRVEHCLGAYQIDEPTATQWTRLLYVLRDELAIHLRDGHRVRPAPYQTDSASIHTARSHVGYGKA
jgi:hypothetical protein